MNKKTLVKKLSSLLIILAILIQMFPIATYAQENAIHTSRVRHVRALRAGAPETYVKFSIRSHTGENIMGQVQYNLVEVDGGSEKIYKNGFVSFVKPDVEFTGLKLNTTYKMYIKNVPPGYERPVQSVAEFYFDTSGIHFTKGSGGIVLRQTAESAKVGMGFFVQDTSGAAVKPVTFELTKEDDNGDTPISIQAKPGTGNRYDIDITKRDIELNKKYKLKIKSAPNKYQLPTGNVAEFYFSNEDGKLFIRFTKGGNTSILKKVGEQDKPLAANEYYGFVGYGDKIKVSKSNESSSGAEAFCIRAEDTFPGFGDNAVYKEYINDADALYRAAQRPRVGKKELYDAMRKIYYYCETHKDELLKDYGLNDAGFWRDSVDHEQDYGYYKTMQEAFWYYSNSLDDIKTYSQGSNEYTRMKTAVNHILSESKKVSDSEMKSVKVKTYITEMTGKHSQPYQQLVSFELNRTTEINVLKVDDTENALNGAVFKLEKLGDASFTPMYVGRNQNISQFKFEGLSAGEYRLTEEKAPTGYKPLDGPIDFKIEEQNKKFTITQTSTNPMVTLSGTSMTFKVKNEKLKTRITVNKKWFDADGQEVQRSAGSITYNLMQVSTSANGTTSEKVYKAGETLSASDNWTKTYTDLPVSGKSDNGDDVTYGYYVVETAVPDYGTSYSNSNGAEVQTPKDAAVSSGTITIKNTENMRFLLPETGGLGRTVLYIAGVILVLISAGVIITRKNRLKNGTK
ncbi:SpaA isopeptide-forming pilin-related protein [Mogibacterium diversum]|uniref:SpaA isopeptide-forming pilin-related protein n=1 Tax=Mogibacterium diversum TaxID=114527 RepID=UPI0028D2655C|nr:SpaA isopeptide-forming pilin-related protein [Mogibacterium diversum]